MIELRFLRQFYNEKYPVAYNNGEVEIYTGKRYVDGMQLQYRQQDQNQVWSNWTEVPIVKEQVD